VLPSGSRYPIHVMVRCLLAQAELHRSAGYLDAARARVDETLAVATDKYHP